MGQSVEIVVESNARIGIDGGHRAAIDGGYTIVQILGQGSVMRVKNGPSVVAVGHRAFIRNGAVEGEAPLLDVVVVEV